MPFDKRENAKKYVAQDGDTLAKIAERETAAGNSVTAADLARFNWGAAEDEEIQTYLRDELGCRNRDEAKAFLISTADEPQGELLIPVRFKKSGLAERKPWVVRVKKKTSPSQFVGCAKLPGVTFGFDTSFIRPSVVEHLEPLETAITKHPDAKIIVFGHTDKVGDAAYNKKLSERRARSAYAFIINDADAWEALYKEEKWGIRVVQEILKDMGDPFDPGPVDGVDGPQTQKAVREYQTARGLAVDGKAGPNTRAVLFKEYMTGKHDVEVTADRFTDPAYMGCGEFNPIEDTEAKSEPNRRVTFYLFHPERLPKFPCKAGNTAPCDKQMKGTGPRHTETFKCSFYDSIAKLCPCEGGPTPPVTSEKSWLAVQVFFYGEPVEGLEVELFETSDGKSAGAAVGEKNTTDANGVVAHDALVDIGNYLCRIENQRDTVVTTTWDVKEPFSVVLPVGMTIVEYDYGSPDDVDEDEAEIQDGPYENEEESD